MKTPFLNTSVKMLFALLRASLHEREPEQSFFRDVSGEDWKQCYRVAAQQGVMALAWDGAMKLPMELQPPIAIKLSWATGVEAYEKKYRYYCATVDELSRFYATHGISTMQLKGVGFSTLYPVPCHREGGDIDIYTYSADRTRMSDREANRLADELMTQQGIEVDCSHSYKHSNFYYKGIPFENHKVFLNVKGHKIAGEMDRLLLQLMNPRPVSLAQGEVLIPSPVFNTLFIAFHTAQHYCSGLALHHLCDWAMILHRYGLQIPEEIKDRKFLSAIAAFTCLCNRYLGTSQTLEGGEKIADEMLSEILSPCYSSKIPARNKVGIVIYKTKRLLHVHRLMNKILDTSLAERIWSSVIWHLRDPKSIFKG